MAHPDELKELCKLDYVIFRKSITDISRDRGVPVKTLYNWRKAASDDDWDRKRDLLDEHGSSLHAELFELAKVCSRKIRMDLLDGTEPDERIFSLQRILKVAISSLKYEAQVPPPDASPDAETPEQKRQKLASTAREILGLT